MPRPFRGRRSGALALALLLAGFGVAAATGGGQTPRQAPPQTPPSQEPQRPIFRIEANFVRVDVFPSVDGVPVQDLTADDFEVLEDGVPQKVETFEHVVVRPAALEEKVDPGSQRRMYEEAAEPRHRVFVVFLDTAHVSVMGSHAIAEPLIRLMDKILGPDDLVGFLTPEMGAASLTLGRKTEVFEEGLRRNWTWGTRDSLFPDEIQREYEVCFPYASDVANEMTARRRERATLEALQELVWHLGAIREERKAILVVTEGWLRYRPDPTLLTPRVIDPASGTREPMPGRDPVGVGPGGKIVLGDPRNIVGVYSKSKCDADRMALANQDDEQFFRSTLLPDANRNNASFYPIDPRGLVVFESPIGPAPPPPPDVDFANVRNRLESLHELALNTDGIAVVNSNDLDAGLRKVADDLTSYYLLGYYSTNTTLDGRFRQIKVRVKRPGVDVRARRGYRAATEEEIAAGRAAAEPPDPAMAAVETALGTLARIRADARFRINVVPGPAGSGGVWIAGEIEPSAAREFARGSTADILASGDGASGVARVSLGPGERAFLTWLEVTEIGDALDVRARLTPAAGSALPVTDAVRVTTGGKASQPLLFRRGPTTGNRVQPAADPRFSRSERLHLELPVGPGVEPGAGRVLDRAGQPLAPPIEVGTREDEATGQRWITADATLAPLGAGDYVVEVTIVDAGTTERVLTAIRVVR